jgi:hypothetical protein
MNEWYFLAIVASQNDLKNTFCVSRSGIENFSQSELTALLEDLYDNMTDNSPEFLSWDEISIELFDDKMGHLAITSKNRLEFLSEASLTSIGDVLYGMYANIG